MTTRKAKSKATTTHLPAQPGDIWVTKRKNIYGVGSKLMCTDEEWDEYPGFFKFYYLIGCANIGPWTFINTKTMDGFDLYERNKVRYPETSTQPSTQP